MRTPCPLTFGCLVLLGVPVGGARAADASASLQTIAGVLPAACMPAEKAKLRTAVLHVAAGRASDDAWNLAAALICDSGDATTKFLSMHTPERIAVRVEGASPSVSFVGPDTSELAGGYAKGHAWGATAEAEGRDLAARFSTGETCWAGFILRFNGSRWLVAELNGGCD